MSRVAWLHDDALRHWYGSAPAVYVFDDAKLKQDEWSLKRIGFVYECLLELPVEIRRGDPVQVLRAFQKEHGAASIITMKTPDPRLRNQIEQLQAEVVSGDEFVALQGPVSLRRFSKYWAKAERVLRAGR